MTELVNNLLAIPITDVSLTFVWYDNGNDSVELNERIFIVDSSGPVTLIQHSGSIYKAVDHINLLDITYNDSEDIDADRFYSSYKTHYQTETLTLAEDDLSMNIIITSSSGITTIENSFENNDLYFDLSAFIGITDDSVRTEQFDIALDTNLTYLTPANTSNTSTMSITFTRAGVSVPNIPILYVGATSASCRGSENTQKKTMRNT